MADVSVHLPFEVVFDPETNNVRSIVFIDTTNGKKYKLQVTNGVIEAVEVV